MGGTLSTWYTLLPAKVHTVLAAAKIRMQTDGAGQ